MRRLNVLLMVFCLLFTFCANADLIFKTKSGETVRLVIQDPNKELAFAKEARELCGDSFVKTYAKYNVKAETLGFENASEMDQFYRSKGFDEDLEFFKAGKSKWVHAIAHKKSDLSDSGELIGWATFWPDGNAADTVYVNTLVVSPDYQKQGVGKKLLFSVREDKDLLPETKHLFLDVRRNNKNAVEFYKKNEFSETKYSYGDHKPNKHLLTLKWSVE